MDVLQGLLTQYSLSEIFLVVAALIFTTKGLSSSLEWLYNKTHNHFFEKIQSESEIEEIKDEQNDIREVVDELKKEFNSVVKSMDTMNLRMQENTRSYIVDKHHYFKYKIKAIDDYNLECLERKYLYYKAAKGNSFIDGCMEDLRALPRVSFDDLNATVACLSAVSGEDILDIPIEE